MHPFCEVRRVRADGLVDKRRSGGGPPDLRGGRLFTGGGSAAPQLRPRSRRAGMGTASLIARPALDSVPENLREPLALWWERAFAQAALLEGFAALPAHFRAELPRVAAGSEFIASVLIQDPQALEWFGRHEQPSAAHIANTDYESLACAAPTLAEAQRILREWRRREMLRIAWRDITDRAGVIETLHAVSDFADAAIRAAAMCAQLHLQPVFGKPRGADAEESQLIV